MDRRTWQINCFYMAHPNSLFKSCSCSKETEVPLLLLICLQRVCFSPPSQVSLPLQQNEVSKYISFSCTRSHFFCFPCFVLSHLFITAYIWHVCKCHFFFDFCSSNICFLDVTSGEQRLLFIV